MTLDIKAKKHVLRLMHHNVAIVTSGQNEDILGATVTWLMQSSFDPPLVTLAIKSDSRLYELIKESGRLIINLVESGDKKLAATFFKPQSLESGQMGGYEAKALSPAGAVLSAIPGWLNCELREIVERGDHHLVVVEVTEAEIIDADKQAMVLSETNWHYGG